MNIPTDFLNISNDVSIAFLVGFIAGILFLWLTESILDKFTAKSTLPGITEEITEFNLELQENAIAQEITEFNLELQENARSTMGSDYAQAAANIAVTEPEIINEPNTKNTTIDDEQLVELAKLQALLDSETATQSESAEQLRLKKSVISTDKGFGSLPKAKPIRRGMKGKGYLFEDKLNARRNQQGS